MSNPIVITDNRIADEWPTGAKPVTKAVAHDDFNRVKLVEYQYSGVTANNDAWTPRSGSMDLRDGGNGPWWRRQDAIGS